MKTANIDDLINAIADNHGMPAPAKAETAAAKTALRKKKKNGDEDENTPRVEEERHDDPAASGEAPLQLAQAETGVATDAAPSGASGASAGETTVGAAAGGLSLGGLALGGLALGGIAAAAGGGGGAAAIDNFVPGTLLLGPVIASNGLKVEVYAADGITKLGESTVDANGTFTVNIGSYAGIVIARVVDTNGEDPDYLDEATGAAKDVNANLMAVSVVSGGTATLNINPLTTIAAQKAGLAADGSGSLADATAVTNANAAVAKAFGLTDLTGTPVVPTNGGDYDPADGLSAGEKYGAILAALSGADKNNGGDSQATIDQFVAAIDVTDDTGTLNEDSKTLLALGANTAAMEVGEDLSSVIDRLLEPAPEPTPEPAPEPTPEPAPEPTPDTTAPVFSGATVSGNTLVLTYGEALDATNLPAAGAFTVKVDGTAQAAPTQIVVDAAAGTVTLTLAAAVTSYQTVTVSYTDPTTGNDTFAIQDVAGNDAATVTDLPAPCAIDPLAPSLSVVASAGAEANQIKLTVTTSALPAGISTAALSFTGLPAGASVRNGDSEVVTAGVAGFSGSGIFTVEFPETADIGQDLWVTVTGKDAGGTETGHNVQAIDLAYDVSSSTEMLSFSSLNQSMWGDVDSHIGWHEYIPLLGGAPIVWNPQTEEWDDVADGDFAAARETANAAAQAAVDTAKVVFNATAFAVDPAVQAAFDAAKLNFDTHVNNQTLAQLSVVQATYDQATTSYQQGINSFAAAKAVYDAAETVWNGQVAWYNSLDWITQPFYFPIQAQNEAIWNVAQTSYSQAQTTMAVTQGVFDAAAAAYSADTLTAEFAQATAAFNAAEATYNAAKQATYDSALTVYEAAQQAAWGTVGQVADDNGYWHSGKFSVIDIDLDSAQILDTVSAAANTVLDAAKTVFDATKDVIDQGLNTAVAAAKGVLELAEDALYGAARTVDQGVRDAFLLAKNTYAAAKVVYDQASYAFNTIATGLHNAADQAWAKALSDWNNLSDWDKFWWGNAAKEAAWGAHVIADGLYYGVDVLGVHIPGAVEIWNGAKSFFETTATDAYNLALNTYNAAAAAADQALQDAFNAAKHTLDVAEQAVQDALDFAYNGALVIYNGVQSGVQTAINEINSKLDFDSALKVDAEVFAQVGLQVDFVLDAGSVDTDVDYQLTSTTQYNKTTDMLAITPTMTNMTTGTSVAFDTISPNAKFYAALLYDVSADFDVFVDGKLVVNGTTIYDMSPTSDGFTLQFPVSTDMLDDVVNMADELGKASNITVPALDLSDIKIGKQVLVNFDSTALEPYEIPYLKALTQDILTLEVALPTLETAGTAATYAPMTTNLLDSLLGPRGTFEEQIGLFPYASFDFSEIIGTFLNTLFPKFDFGEDFIANYDLESLGLPTYLELLQSIKDGQTTGADINRTIAETVDSIANALLTAIVDVLDGHAATGAIFVVDMTDETASSLVHLNLFPDSVIGDTTSAATGSFGFYAAYGESDPLIKATVNIDGAYDLIVKEVLKLVLTAVGVVFPLRDELIDAMPTQFNNALGIETILDLAEADEATKTAVTEVLQLGYNFETVNLDISHEANVSQEFTLSIDDMSYLVTLEDGTQQTFTANGTGGLLIEHASSHDANGDGSLAYTLDIVPAAMFSNDTEIGLGYGYELDFLKGTIEAGVTLPLGTWLGLPDWANISYSALDLDLGPLLRVQGDLDTLDVDVFESRFALDVGSASYAGAVDIALVNTSVMG